MDESFETADYVVYGTYYTFSGAYEYAAIIKDGKLTVLEGKENEEKAKSWASDHPDKHIVASTHPACGIMFTMPDGRSGRNIPVLDE